MIPLLAREPWVPGHAQCPTSGGGRAMSRQLVSAGLMFGLGLLTAGVANAAITGTYVDATLDNTTTTPPGDLLPAYNDTNDNRWTFRDFTGTEGGTVIEGNGPGQENNPVLTTTVTGVAPGTYDLYVIYHTNDRDGGGPGSWGIQAGPSGGALNVYNSLNGTFV